MKLIPVLLHATRAFVVACAAIATSAAAAAPCDSWSKNTLSAIYDGDRLLDGGWIRKPESNTVVVFVHGIFSNNRDAWLHAGDTTCAYWPELLKQDGAFDGAGIFVASYYTSFTSGNFDVRHAANHLQTVLETPWRGHPYAALKYPNVIFVAHSLGGVVARQLLLAEWQKWRQRRLGLVLMASPAKGSGWADRAEWIAAKFNNSMALQLRPDDPLLNDIHQKFLSLVRHDPEGRNVAGTEQFENQFLTCSMSFYWCLFTSATLRNVVTEHDAGGYFGAAQIVPDTDHSTIVKPDSLYTQSHIRLRNFFLEHFAAAQKRFPPDKGHGTLALVGAKPRFGWKPVQTRTLHLTAYDGSCSQQRPQGCLAELPSVAAFSGMPSAGALRWRAAPDKRVTVMAGDPERYSFVEELAADKVRVWATIDHSKPSGAASYARDFVLEEYVEVATEPFRTERPLCGASRCTVEVLVPPDVRLSEVIEAVPMGAAAIPWKANQVVSGNVVYLHDSIETEGGMRHIFVLK